MPEAPQIGLGRLGLIGGGNRHDLVLPRVDLSALLPVAAATWIRSRGGKIRTSCRISRIEPSAKGFTLHWYDQLIHDGSLIQAALHSLAIAAVSATAACLIGTVTALAIQRWRFVGRKSIHAVLFVMMM